MRGIPICGDALATCVMMRGVPAEFRGRHPRSVTVAWAAADGGPGLADIDCCMFYTVNMTEMRVT